MAPNKFEDNIKDKLENRRLQTSPEAWSHLSDRLEHQEKGQKGFPFWLLGVAASIIGVLLVVTQFLMSDIKETPPEIVGTPEVILQDENTQVTLDESTNIIMNQGESKVIEEKKPLKRVATLNEQSLTKKLKYLNKLF